MGHEGVDDEDDFDPGFHLCPMAANRGKFKHRDVEFDTRNTMMKLSRDILVEISDICYTKSVNFANCTLLELNELIPLLSGQRGFVDRAWLLHKLWFSRDGRSDWLQKAVLSLGTNAASHGRSHSHHIDRQHKMLYVTKHTHLLQLAFSASEAGKGRMWSTRTSVYGSGRSTVARREEDIMTSKWEVEVFESFKSQGGWEEGRYATPQQWSQEHHDCCPWPVRHIVNRSMVRVHNCQDTSGALAKQTPVFIAFTSLQTLFWPESWRTEAVVPLH
jgi:hypothetical protein